MLHLTFEVTFEGLFESNTFDKLYLGNFRLTTHVQQLILYVCFLQLQ